MPYARPTLTDLKAQAAADMATAVPGADPLLRFSNLGVMGRVLAALSYGLYGYLDWIARQAVPGTCDGEYLEMWAALKGVIRKGATSAGVSSPIEVTFSGGNGTVLPSGTDLVRSDGAAYQTTGSGTVSSGTVTVPCGATDTGSATTCTVGQVMTIETAIAGINSTGAVSTAGSAGADVETDDELRTRMLDAYQAPPMGGADSDYVNWALDVPGVTRAWIAPLAGGAGTVTVYFMMDVAEAAFSGFPQGTDGVATNETRAAAATGDQLTLANAIYPLRPVTALVTAAAPGANAVAFTINGISGASTATKAAIAAAISAVFLASGAPGGTVDAQGNAVQPVDLSAIEAAIAAIAGTAGFVITAVSCPHGTVSPGTDGNITSNAGYLPVLGVVTYT